MNHAETIINLSAEHFGIPVYLLKAKTRKKEIVVARQSAMAMLKEFTSLTKTTIGVYFGNRDHSTVIHALQTIEDYQYTSTLFFVTLNELREKVRAVVGIQKVMSPEKVDAQLEDILP